MSESASAGERVPAAAVAMPPAPVPMQFGFGTARGPAGEAFVVMQVITPVGQAVYFLGPEEARSVGTALLDTAQAVGAGGGLLLPPGAGGLVVPGRPQGMG